MPRTSVPITEHEDRVIAVLAGSPDDVGWLKVHEDAADTLENSRSKLKTPSAKELEHRERRGFFPQEAVGESMGGGQSVRSLFLVNAGINLAQVPGTLKSTSKIVIDYVMRQACFIRIAGFQSGKPLQFTSHVKISYRCSSAAFSMWAPQLFKFYSDQLGKFYSHYPDIKKNFYNSIFACCTFNFGPSTVCFCHTDPGNLPFGWCAITALGNFDSKRGGHLILWDLYLVIEFPPGATILIPSASLRHGNTAIQAGETRYSFTQYTAGGVFRWVEQGFQKTTEWWKTLSKAERAMESERGKERWAMGVGLFSKLSSLQQAPNFDRVA